MNDNYIAVNENVIDFIQIDIKDDLDSKSNI